MNIKVIFVLILLIFGDIEVITNLFHLTRGAKNKIAQSAKKQHGELPKNLSDGHYIIKAGIMLSFGLIFIVIGFIPFSYTMIRNTLVLFSVYGIIQAIVYRGYWATLSSAIVYSMPYLLFMLLISK